jgi:hypothetical protein
MELAPVIDIFAGASLQGPTAKELLFDEIEAELAELCGQRNAIDGRIAELVAKVDAEELLAGTGLRSLEHFCTWQLGVSSGRAKDLVAVAERLDDLPVTTGLLRDGLLSVDQVAAVAKKAPSSPDADEHFAGLARQMTVSQLQRALRSATNPPTQPEPTPAPERQIATWWDDDDCWNAKVRLPKVDGAVADAALRSHLDALVNEHKAAHGKDAIPATDPEADRPPFPTLADAWMRLVEHGWDADATVRPHGHRTTVIVHVDVDTQDAEIHLGPALSDAERRYLACDARFETWFERNRIPIGAARTTREIPRRVRRALERRDRCCRVPGCSATAGLHAHHLIHWEDGGPTELWNLALVYPFHHRAHHNKTITIRGPADQLQVTDRRGRLLTGVGPGGASAPPGPELSGSLRTVHDMTTNTDLMPTVEHAELLATLETHRSFLRHTITGLTREQATATPTPSPLCVGGIVKHVAAQERSWIRFVVEGPSSMAFTPEALEAHAAQFVLLPEETVDSVLADCEATAVRTADVVAATHDLGASHPLPEAPWFEPGARWSARRVLYHLIAETAQHAGHADIIREAIDGQRTMA